MSTGHRNFDRLQAWIATIVLTFAFIVRPNDIAMAAEHSNAGNTGAIDQFAGRREEASASRFESAANEELAILIAWHIDARHGHGAIQGRNATSSH